MKVASIEEYRHLLFTGEVPTGFKLEDDRSCQRYLWVIRKGNILDQVYRMYSGDGFWVALLDTGFLCFVNNGYKDAYLKEADTIWVGEGVCHYKVTRL